MYNEKDCYTVKFDHKQCVYFKGILFYEEIHLSLKLREYYMSLLFLDTIAYKKSDVQLLYGEIRLVFLTLSYSIIQ